METEKNELDYARLWKTLMRIGVRQSFSQVRKEFFMKLATDGPRKYYGEDLDEVVKDARGIIIMEGFKDTLREFIKESDAFKYYSYQNEDDDFIIDYVANINSPITKEVLVAGGVDDSKLTYPVEGVCIGTNPVVKTIYKDGTEVERSVTYNLILVSEDNGKITSDEYPKVIKHELTHSIINYFTNNPIKDVKDIRIPNSWSIDMKEWEDDVDYLYTNILNSEDRDAIMFLEFVADFLMYESDGQTKVQNPVYPSEAKKAAKEGTKPNVTYRTLTPFDRFQEEVSDELGELYQKYLNPLKEFYSDYGSFLDDIKL